MNRVARITKEIVSHVEDIGARAVVVAIEDWPGEHASNLRSPLGFTAPEPTDPKRPPGTEWVAHVAPELIAAQTAHLNEEDFEDYVAAIIYCLDIEVSLWDKGLGGNPQGRIDAVDAGLAELAPGSLRLMSQVQMTWLDQSN